MKNKTAFIIMTAALLLIFGCGKKEQGKTSRETKTTRLEKGNITIQVLATGTLSPYRRIEVKNSDRGRVEKLFYDESQSVRQGETMALISTIDRISLLDMARANLYNARRKGDAAKIREAEDEVKTAEQAYQPVPIIAPVSGEVIKLSVQVGEIIGADTVLFVLSDRLILNVSVDEADIGKITMNQNVNFYLDTFPDERYKGHVRRISREGQLVSNVMQYEVLVFPDKVLKKWISGMTVNAEFIVTEKKNIHILPYDAVYKDKGTSYVVVLEKGGVQKKKEVKTGITDYKTIEIVSGAGPEDEILLLTKDQFDKAAGPNQRGSNTRDQRRMMRNIGGMGGPGR